MHPPSITTPKKSLTKKKPCIFVKVVSTFKIVVEFCNSKLTVISKALKLTHQQNTSTIYIKLY
jgi:hypothetical protein